MPTINGMKMACEPCIRGHRSTKCTHASERLMVPVRKPGRPLSACPHPRDQSCGCGSVTAAIPRKQTCHCGGGTESPAIIPEALPKEVNPAIAEAPSPTRVTFKVQKGSSRPQSSRKQSFDPMNIERMDMNSVNIVPFEQRPHGMPNFPNGYAMNGPPQSYGYLPEYANIQTQYVNVPQAQYPVTLDLPNGNSRLQNVLEHMPENDITSPTQRTNGKPANGNSCCAPAAKPATNGQSNGVSSGSCCSGPPKLSNHSHSSSSASSISEPQEITTGSCCSSKAAPQIPKTESLSSQSTPINMTPIMSHHILSQNGMVFNPALYPQYMPQATVFTYPATYGSFQNPLQPSAWRQSVLANSYTTPHTNNVMAPIPFATPLAPESLDTVHTCSCGDTCQCVGCAAHPYNDATQSYVRSAWEVEQPSNEVHTNGNPTNGNGNISIQTQGLDNSTSPTAHTPSSTTSGTGEEQTLSANDFFFVNYPFTSEGCGGDTQSCPCGDDCECPGCTIHRPQHMPCAGDKDYCPCGDDCECIGCEIHNGDHTIGIV